ncbi:MAG: hypothetical protein K6U14_09595, partial [Firmicutes bacterium]|nr:hypothetical protein [Alicyclobacillaceae bacterium]MCL6497866.1 hypothetical protein [Bacillota bacterium]
MSSDALELVDTTLRDGAQSLWASEMRTGIIEAVGPDLDRAGFAAVEVPMNPIYFKKFIRDVKEDPWEMARVIVEVLPHSVKACMAGPIIDPFGPPPPQVAVELFYRRLIERGALNRVQLVANTYDQIARAFPWMIPFYKSLGVQVAVALAYTLSPRHTDAYYAEKARQVLAFAPDAVYLKDQGGLLTPERVRTL